MNSGNSLVPVRVVGHEFLTARRQLQKERDRLQMIVDSGPATEEMELSATLKLRELDEADRLLASLGKMGTGMWLEYWVKLRLDVQLATQQYRAAQTGWRKWWPDWALNWAMRREIRRMNEDVVRRDLGMV